MKFFFSVIISTELVRDKYGRFRTEHLHKVLLCGVSPSGTISTMEIYSHSTIGFFAKGVPHFNKIKEGLFSTPTFSPAETPLFF